MTPWNLLLERLIRWSWPLLLGSLALFLVGILGESAWMVVLGLTILGPSIFLRMCSGQIGIGAVDSVASRWRAANLLGKALLLLRMLIAVNFFVIPPLLFGLSYTLGEVQLFKIALWVAGSSMLVVLVHGLLFDRATRTHWLLDLLIRLLTGR